MSEKPEKTVLAAGGAECAAQSCTEKIPENDSENGKESNAGGIACAIVASVLVVSIIGWLIFRMFAPEPEALNSEFQIMGTIARVSVYDTEDSLIAADMICQQEFAEVNRICSLYDRESELSRLNATAAAAPFHCSPEMWSLLMRAKQAYIDSDGNFDVTVKPLMDLWGFYRKRDQIPSDKEILDTMKVVGFDKVEFNEKDRTVLFTVPGMSIDLGGIAKGYAIDRAAEKIISSGIDSGIIDLGGNLRLLPQPPPGKKFYRVAIRDPHNRNKTLPEPLTVKPGLSVSTSGDYERFVIFNGKKFSHIISPKTGHPGSVSAVTVIAGSAMDADVFSTSCALGGEPTAEKIRAKYPDVEIYFTR